MFFESDFYSIFIPAIIAIAIFSVGYYFWQRNQKNELEKAISLFKVSTIAVGLLSIFLLFMLPSTPALGSFGLPETVEEIQSNEQLLNYLQEFNHAIVRTTQVVHWFIFIFVWWFLTSAYAVAKVFSTQQGEEYFKNVKEKFAA